MTVNIALLISIGINIVLLIWLLDTYFQLRFERKWHQLITNASNMALDLSKTTTNIARAILDETETKPYPGCLCGECMSIASMEAHQKEHVNDDR